jgi:uroporphyrinogen decarboxylase-like protein
VAQVTQRQRFLDTLMGAGSDRFPFYDLEPDEEILSRWRGEGLPAEVSFAEYFGLELHHSVGLTIRSSPFFRMAPDLLTDPSSFERHYDPEDPSRYEAGFVEKCRRLRKEGRVLYVDASGGGLLQMLGVGDWESLKSACHALVKRPEFVEDLVHRTTDFYCVCLERVLSKVKVDYASFYEPIASNTGPVVSPAMFERFAIPGYRKVLGLLEKFHVPLRILCTTGGNLKPLLPSLVDAGINCFWISNIMSAGMEYGRLRKEFGSHVALIGGIDSLALGLNEKAIRTAVEKTVPPLLESGRYLPCLDDRPRSNIPLAHYRSFRRILEEIARQG